MFGSSGGRSCGEWFAYMQKHKPQSNALVGGIIIMIFSGQHLAWGIFNNNFGSQAWISNPMWSPQIRFWLFWVVASWFIAGIVGGFIGGILVQTIKKNRIYVSN